MELLRHPERPSHMRTAVALGCSSLLLLLVSCENESVPKPAPTPSIEASSTPPPAEPPLQGDAATWLVDGQVSEAFLLVFVTRLGCNGGITGKVLEPTVEYDNTRVVITFQVERGKGAPRCPASGNKAVAYEVALTEPIGDRVLVDGQCLPGGEARRTEQCSNNGVRSVVY